MLTLMMQQLHPPSWTPERAKTPSNNSQDKVWVFNDYIIEPCGGGKDGILARLMKERFTSTAKLK